MFAADSLAISDPGFFFFSFLNFIYHNYLLILSAWMNSYIYFNIQTVCAF